MLHNESLLGLTSLFWGPLCVHCIMLCARITHYPLLDLDTAKIFSDQNSRYFSPPDSFKMPGHIKKTSGPDPDPSPWVSFFLKEQNHCHHSQVIFFDT